MWMTLFRMCAETMLKLIHLANASLNLPKQLSKDAWHAQLQKPRCHSGVIAVGFVAEITWLQRLGML